MIKRKSMLFILMVFALLAAACSSAVSKRPAGMEAASEMTEPAATETLIRSDEMEAMANEVILSAWVWI